MISEKRLQEIRGDLKATIDTCFSSQYVRWIKLYAYELITAYEEMTEAHRLDLEMILELTTKVSELEADCAIALRQMRISDEGNKKLQAELDDMQADNLKALELIVEGQTAEIELITKLDISQARLAEWESGARVTEDRLKLAAELRAELEQVHNSQYDLAAKINALFRQEELWENNNPLIDTLLDLTNNILMDKKEEK